MGGMLWEGESPAEDHLGWINTLELQHYQHLPQNTLLNICAKYVASNLEETVLSAPFSTTDYRHHLIDSKQLEEDEVPLDDFDAFPPHKAYRPRDDVVMPLEVSQAVFNFCMPSMKVTCSPEFYAFTGKALPLAALDFRKVVTLTTEKLHSYLCAHTRTLRYLNLSGITNLTRPSLKHINRYGVHLETLILGSSSHILVPNGGAIPPGNVLSGPERLEKLVVHNLIPDDVQLDVFPKLVGKYLDSLSHLDLSGCRLVTFDFICNINSLRTLLLYNVDLGEENPTGFFQHLPSLPKSIRYLDLSQPGGRQSSVYLNPNELLDLIARSLPNLVSLDISNTNLAGTGVAWHQGQDVADLCCDIPGLNSRSKTPLEYLGLYGTAHDASRRHFIPAKIIGGDGNEMQIINAARVFIDRQEVLEKILNDLFHLFRTDEGKHVAHSMRIILLAMERHKNEKHIQISASASLFYIVKNNQNDTGPVNDMKRRILVALINAMERHSTDPTMMRNGCLTICHFKIPHDVMFLYEKLVGLLLNTLGDPNNEDFNERIAIYLLNSLACQVEGEHKRKVGELGAMYKMMNLIQGRLTRGECDDVMEISWSTMWNVTDETPENCTMFLTCNGMTLFLKCLQAFPNQPELLRNMMGLLGNVAEVKDLRPSLMTEAFITVFYELLNSKQDHIEVSYNAAGVLAHILSDGEEAWGNVRSPSRAEVCDRMTQNIKGWDMHSLRNINYRSFKPILRLLLVQHTEQCRLWACWALANLTTVYPEKYVRLLEEEEGLQYLKMQLESKDSQELNEYAQKVSKNMKDYMNTKACSPPPC